MNIPIIHQYIDSLKGIQNNLILAPTGNLGIPRSAMPQIDSKYRKVFIFWLYQNDVHVSNVRVPALSLKMAQGEYNRDKVGAIMNSAEIGGDPIFVSKDGFIIDGNHRLIAHINLPDAGPYIEVARIDMDARPLLDLIKDCPVVRYRNLNDKG